MWTWPRAIPVPRSRLNALYYYMIAAYRAGFRSLGFSNVTVCVQVLEDPGATTEQRCQHSWPAARHGLLIIST